MKAIYKREFEANMLSIGTPLFVVLVGLYVGGVVGILYALSAVLSYVAFRYRIDNNDDYVSAVPNRHSCIDRLMDALSGSSSVYRANYDASIKQILPTILRGGLMPFSVFVAFYRNYSLEYAIAFIMIVLTIAIGVDRKHTWESSKDYYFKLYMGRSLVRNDYKKFELWYKRYPHIGESSKPYFLTMAACQNNPAAMRYILKEYKPELTGKDVQLMMDIALIKNAVDAVVYIHELGFSVKKNTYVVNERFDCMRQVIKYFDDRL